MTGFADTIREILLERPGLKVGDAAQLLQIKVDRLHYLMKKEGESYHMLRVDSVINFAKTYPHLTKYEAADALGLSIFELSKVLDSVSLTWQNATGITGGQRKSLRVNNGIKPMKARFIVPLWLTKPIRPYKHNKTIYSNTEARICSVMKP